MELLLSAVKFDHHSNAFVNIIGYHISTEWSQCWSVRDKPWHFWRVRGGSCDFAPVFLMFILIGLKDRARESERVGARESESEWRCKRKSSLIPAMPAAARAYPKPRTGDCIWLSNMCGSSAWAFFWCLLGYTLAGGRMGSGGARAASSSTHVNVAGQSSLTCWAIIVGCPPLLLFICRSLQNGRVGLS